MSIVYKYGSIGLEGSEGAIEHFLVGQTLRFASASAQNDVNEAVPNIGALLTDQMRRAAVNRYPERESLNPRWASMTEDQFVRVMYDDGTLGNATKIVAVRAAWKTAHAKFRRFGILSLTKTKTNLLLWSHYSGGKAGAASGLCIGFDSEASVFTDSEYAKAGMRGIHEINYAAARATFEGDTLEKRLAQIVLTKSTEWRYEEELRCIRELPDDGSPLYCEFKAADVRQIVIGSNMPLDSVRKCIRLHAEKFPHAGLLVALPNPAKFEMLFFRCPDEKLAEVAFKELPSDLPPLGL